jgi:hypothetical protein
MMTRPMNDLLITDRMNGFPLDAQAPSALPMNDCESDPKMVCSLPPR